MRFSLHAKIFAAMMTLSTVIVLLLCVALWLTLGQGFDHYVSATELDRLKPLVERLENAYAQHQDWQFLKNGADWLDLIEPDGPRPPDDHFHPDHNGRIGLGGPPPFGMPPHGDLMPNALPMRLALTDPAGNRIAGDPLTTSDAAKRPIRFQGRTVGNLVLRGLPGDRNGIDAAFLAAQGETMLMIGFVSILLCLLLSWLLARQITKPLAALSANVQRIAEGRLDSRISIHGDDEIGDLGRAVNAMADGLASAEEIRRAWISDASHELRTPLAVLQAEIEAIEDQVREPNEATMARLHKQVRQLTHLVDDLRATLDPDLGIERLEPRAVDLPALLAEAVTLFRERFHNAGLGLEWQPAATPIPPFIGDAGRLTQIFTNLLENSLRYSREGGKLRVNLTCDRQFVTLRFDDTPPAPPASALPLLFNRFYRVEPSRSRALGGSGLGLAICKALVEAHRGVIAASESELGGLCITIRLPLATP